MDKVKILLGFTMIEIIIVLIIISLLATAAFVRWPGSGISLDGQAQQLASDIRFTQSLSMTKGERYRLVRLSTTSYQIVNSTGVAILLARGINTVTLSTGIQFGTWTNLPNNLIAFGGDGVPYVDTATPGTALSSTATIILTAGSQTKSISITPTTGRVVVT